MSLKQQVGAMVVGFANKVGAVAAAAREEKRWSGQQSDMPKVFYGYDHMSTRDEISRGGIVKCQILQELYPNVLESPNILYLVSSALPEHVQVMISAAKKNGASVVLNQNGVAYPGWLPKGWEDLNAGLRRVLELSDYVFYQSRFAKEGADRFLAPRERGFEILHNCVDTEFFRPPNSDEGHNGCARLLLAGSQSSFYRVETAVAVLKRLLEKGADVRLTVAGELRWGGGSQSMMLAELNKCVEKAGIKERVQVLPAYTQVEALGIYHDADILLHTQSNDVCPTVVLEAMACGLPVVYCDSGGTSELVGDKAGEGVPNHSTWDKVYPPDADLMAGAVLKILRGINGYKDAAVERSRSRFGLKNWLERHAEVFKTCLADRGKE